MKKWTLVFLLGVVPSLVFSQQPAGLTGLYSMAEWCKPHPFSATYIGFEPQRLMMGLRRAKECNFSLLVVYPRNLYISDGTIHGPYSPIRHRALTDAYAKAIPPDSIKKYVASGTLLGFIPGDDYLCACWGGKKIPLKEAVAAANYAKQKLPDAPVGPRLDALAASTVKGWKVDFFVAFWSDSKSHIKRYKSADNWFKANASAAKKQGAYGMFYGFNAEDCSGGHTDPCSASKITSLGTSAVNQPNSCGTFSWYYNDVSYVGSVKAAWQGVFSKAASKPFVRCKS